MNSISIDIKNLLVKKGEGEAGSPKSSVWGIFVDSEPSEPAHCITVYVTPGIVQKQFNNDRHFYNSAFQIRVRGTDYKRTEQKARSCSEAIDRIGSFLVEPNVQYNNVLMNDEPEPLEKDSQGRFIFVVNGIAFRRKTS